MNASIRRIGYAKRYARTRSFRRLNDRAVAPGSELPKNYFLRRRIVWGAIALAIVLPGIVALVW